MKAAERNCDSISRLVSYSEHVQIWTITDEKKRKRKEERERQAEMKGEIEVVQFECKHTAIFLSNQK